MSALQPLLPVQRSSRQSSHIPAALAHTSHVFLRVDAVRRPLTTPYDGPFSVLSRSPKTFNILKGNREVTVSVDRLKPAFIDVLPASQSLPARPRPPAPAVDVPGPRQPVSPTETVISPPRTRSGRPVVAPDRFGV